MRKMKIHPIGPAAIGTILLILGIAAGVFLVQRSQDIRNKANVETKAMYQMCHKDEKGKWVQIEVGKDQLQDFLNNGDLYGKCPTN
jgi:hypothetical protein